MLDSPTSLTKEHVRKVVLETPCSEPFEFLLCVPIRFKRKIGNATTKLKAVKRDYEGRGSPAPCCPSNKESID